MGKSQQDLKEISKLLSYILRHDPAFINIKLDKNGWGEVKELITKINNSNFSVEIDRSILNSIIANSEKQRFSFSKDEKFIRANYGHSIPAEIDYIKAIPPSILYHGTATKNIDSILEKGILATQRNFVHLTTSIKYAKEVGNRHGKSIVLSVDAGLMSTEGTYFYLFNNMWLTKYVPIDYIKII